MNTSTSGRRNGRGNNVPAARNLRRRLTTAAVVLWVALRDRRFGGHKVRPQHPAGPFVLDVCCSAVRLAIEIDGPIHNQQHDQDAARYQRLVASGYQITRLTNDEILADLPAALGHIHHAIACASPLSRASGEGLGVRAQS